MRFPPFSASISVTAHALERAVQLLGPEWDDKQRIRVDVRSAMLVDRFSERMPDWTRRTRRAGRSEEGIRYVYDSAATRCWVVGAASGSLVVQTLLINYDLRQETSNERRGLRPGLGHG